ncbi:mucoidy inhibitor MuiA family protein [Escherichia fergusonii]|uniref:mucoidy inhibitor MuiA family protein n=1 Tax=Escherichia fergusonii TaxID=564 RepID=UPI0021002CC4|nr:mucoidy inhibitor MuiA family protein [Escherichia fergusonii]
MLILKPLPLAMLLAGCMSSAWGAQLTQPLTLKDVTVYLHGASLQGEETLNLPTGESEIIFTNIANSVTPDSIAIAMDNGVTVLSSRLALQETPSQALLSDVQQQLKAARLEQAKLTAEKDNIAAQVKVLEANNTLTQKNATEVGKYLQMVKEKNGELLRADSELTQKLAENQDAIDKLEQRENMSNGSSDGADEPQVIIARVYAPKAVKTQAVVRYMTPDASWTPLYDIHASAINQPLRLVYKASIRQYTGLAWKNVNMELSTNEPDTHLMLPQLEPQYVDVPEYGDMRSYQQKSLSAPHQRAAADKVVDFEKAAAHAAKEAQAQQASVKSRYVAEKAPVSPQPENLTAQNVHYTLSLPWQIDSDNTARTVVIKEESVAGDYRFFAIPKLSNDVYLQIQIKEWEQLNLIPGESQIFFGNNRTGLGYLQPPEDGNSLDIQLNRDPKLIIQRKAVLKKENTISIFNDSVVRNFSYTVTVKNSYGEAVDLTLVDQIPISSHSDITVDKMQYGQAQLNAKTGELSWKLHLAGKENVSLPFSYSVKYPKNIQPSGL